MKIVRVCASTLSFAASSCATMAYAQAAPSAFTTGYRYDPLRRLVGTISPNDGSGRYPAVRNTYDAAGRLTKVETGYLTAWESEAVLPVNWGTAFTVLKTLDTTYDALDRKAQDKMSASGTALTLVQYNYDALGRPQCVAQRMDPAQWATQTDACTPQITGPNGADRVVRNFYDNAGELIQVRQGVGTTVERAETTMSYTPNGKRDFIIDAKGARAELTYDGFDRQQDWIFPSGTLPTSFNDSSQSTALSTAGQTNTGDFEQYGYDANGNRTSLRKRDGRTLTFTYDALNRMSSKVVPDACVAGFICGTPPPSAVRDVFYDYDLLGRELHAKFDALTGTDGITNTYNGFGELTSSSVTIGTFTKSVCSSTQLCQFDGDGNRTQVTLDGQAFTYGFDGLDRLSGIYEGTSAVSTASVDQFAYNADGTLHSRTEATGTSQPTVTYGYDGIERLTNQADAFPTNATTAQSNVNWTFTRNPASELGSETRDNNTYAYGTLVSTSPSYTVNGLNQYTAIASSSGTASLCYDSNGNLTADGTSVYLYDAENRLIQKRAQTSPTCPNGSTGYTGSLQANVTYDPLGRLVQVDQGTAATTTDFLYDGDALVGEYDSTGATLKARYVHGSNMADDPLVWYTTSALTSRRFLHADHLGSIVAMTNGTSAVSVNAYDEYGIPKTDSTGTVLNTGRFQYTGQAYIPELGMYYYKARIYSPRLGRFMQIDPVGYDDQMNLYGYVTDDPINKSDPSGHYEKDVHYFLTEVLARAAGISPKVAKEIASADQGVDDNPATAPIGGSHWLPFGHAVTVRAEYHFTTRERRIQLRDQFKKSRSPNDLGIYLHAKQDAFAHVGFGPRFGHARVGTAPDMTFNNIPKADAMALNTFNNLVAAKNILGEDGREVPYGKIAEMVHQFNSAETDATKEAALSAILGYVDNP